MPKNPPDEGRLILVSNRLPVVMNHAGQGWNVRTAAGGLATGLSGPHQSSGGRWIGWPGVVTDNGELGADVTTLLEDRQMVGVGLTPDQHERYYNRMSNRCLWPLFHYFSERVNFDAEDWKVYQEVNRKFADAVLAEVQPDDVVFVQDFHLCLVPAMLRAAIPDLRIGFFLHIPFPSSEIYRVFARREEVLRGLLGADVIGFHTLGYVRHFRSAVSHLLGEETRSTEVSYQGRKVKLLAQPLGIEPKDWDGGEVEDDVQREVDQLRQAVAGRRLILGVERLDYTKGVPERLRAFGDMLREDPSQVEKVMMIQIAVPSRIEVEEYRELKDEVDRLAGNINSEFGRPGLQALHYQFRGVSPTVLRALYRLADVCLVTPLRDGLNLVAKEFVASRQDDDGVLVLGENTGAAWELGEALRVNPYDAAAMVEVLKRALQMPIAERKSRMQPMRERVATSNVHVWAERCISAIRHAEIISPPPNLGGEHERAMHRVCAKAQRRHLFLDYDGTLREFTGSPKDAQPTQEILNLLTQLAQVQGMDTWVVSGRPSCLLEKWIGSTGVGLISEHGSSVRISGGAQFESLLATRALDWRDEVVELMNEFALRVPRSRVELKPLGVAWHYREASLELSAWQARELYQHLVEILTDRAVDVMRGNRVIEVRPAGVSKGSAVMSLLGEDGLENENPDTQAFILAIGDDVTDESMFRELPSHAWTVLVGERESTARYRLSNPKACRDLIARLPLSLNVLTS
jgi:trehalose 6-phosphate synthase/phosphatase